MLIRSYILSVFLTISAASASVASEKKDTLTMADNNNSKLSNVVSTGARRHLRSLDPNEGSGVAHRDLVATPSTLEDIFAQIAEANRKTTALETSMIAERKAAAEALAEGNRKIAALEKATAEARAEANRKIAALENVAAEANKKVAALEKAAAEARAGARAKAEAPRKSAQEVRRQVSAKEGRFDATGFLDPHNGADQHSNPLEISRVNEIVENAINSLQNGVFHPLKADVTELKDKLKCIYQSDKDDELLIERCNVRIHGGGVGELKCFGVETHKLLTDDSCANAAEGHTCGHGSGKCRLVPVPNGKGNLIVGAGNAMNVVSTGSGNVVIGSGHTFSGINGLVVGDGNKLRADNGMVVGVENTVAAEVSAVVGGTRNKASSSGASVVLGGHDNQASGRCSAAMGGHHNQARNYASAAVGGSVNKATAIYSAVVGGQYNQATAPFSAVLGGNSTKNQYAGGMLGSAELVLS